MEHDSRLWPDASALVTGARRGVSAPRSPARFHRAGASSSCIIGHSRAEARSARRVVQRAAARFRARLRHATCSTLQTLPALVERRARALRSSGHPRQQRLDVLSDAARLDHARAVGRPHRHEPARAAVPRAGVRAGMRARRADHEYGRHSRATTASRRTPSTRWRRPGLSMLTKSLARELAPDVRVNGIAPGPVLWPEAASTRHCKREIVAKTALKRSGSPDDVARAALYLAADAPFVTGQIIAVDGGRSLGWSTAGHRRCQPSRPVHHVRGGSKPCQSSRIVRPASDAADRARYRPSA